jgi:four helix bundle suffix protein
MSDKSDQSDEKLLPPHGGYRRLRSFQAAQLAYDATQSFCDRFIERRSRTHDQMVQAARSGVQNIAEGSMASATSRRTELKLTNVARASLEELRLDYEDFLRQRGLRQWSKDEPQALAWRKLLQSDKSDGSDRSDGSDVLNRLRQADRQEAANAILCLVHQASFLLHRQITHLERTYLEEGGFGERMYRLRSGRRG